MARCIGFLATKTHQGRRIISDSGSSVPQQLTDASRMVRELSVALETPANSGPSFPFPFKNPSKK